MNKGWGIIALVVAALLVPRNSAAAPARKYDCTKLVTDAEMQTATGLASAALTLQGIRDGHGRARGVDGLPILREAGALSIGLTVATGAAVTLTEAAVFSGPAGGAKAFRA